MRKLSTQTGGYRGCLGLSLRGSCDTTADISLLKQAFDQLATTRATRIWVDCQALHALSETGEQALLHIEQLARAAGITLCWCGLPTHLQAQLSAGHAQPLLNLLPAEAYQGPALLRAL